MVFWGQRPKLFWLFNVFGFSFKQTVALKNYIHDLRSHTSSQLLFFLLMYQLMAEYNTTQRRISHPVASQLATGIIERFFPFQYCTHTEVHVNKAQSNEYAVSCTYSPDCHRRCCIRQLFLKILQYPHETHVLESIFKKLADLQTCNFIKKRPQYRCFPVYGENF